MWSSLAPELAALAASYLWIPEFVLGMRRVCRSWASLRTNRAHLKIMLEPWDSGRLDCVVSSSVRVLAVTPGDDRNLWERATRKFFNLTDLHVYGGFYFLGDDPNADTVLLNALFCASIV